MGRLKVDLHDIYGSGEAIEAALSGAIEQAVAKRLELVEIIPGKGSGQLKKSVLRFLERGEIKRLYHRIEKGARHWGTGIRQLWSTKHVDPLVAPPLAGDPNRDVDPEECAVSRHSGEPERTRTVSIIDRDGVADDERDLEQVVRW